MNKPLLTLSALIALAFTQTLAYAGSEDDGGSHSVFYGVGAGDALTGTGFSNAFFGYQAGFKTTTGSTNTFSGYQVGYSNTIGERNTFSGAWAGFFNTEGDYNVFSGSEAGRSNTTGSYNTFSGYQVGYSNTTGDRNTFSGSRAGYFNTTGIKNTFLGNGAGQSNISGNYNTFLGNGAGFHNQTGEKNLFLGYDAGYDETSSNKLYIETDFTSRTTPLIYGEFDTNLVGINGILGIGTQLPTSTLHIQRADGTAKAVVEETSATVAARTLFELKNAGNTKFNINNTDAGVEWAFTNSGNDFRVSRQGSGVVEFALSNAGNLTIQGNLTELSSRTQKHNIVAMSSKQALNKVLTLPIKEWSYKDSQQGTRHIGPMAEDFYAAFGLGESETGIATLDTSGVALAAIQGLKAEKDAQIEALKASKNIQDEKLANQNKKLAQQETNMADMQAELAKLKEIVQRLTVKDQWASLD